MRFERGKPPETPNAPYRAVRIKDERWRSAEPGFNRKSTLAPHEMTLWKKTHFGVAHDASFESFMWSWDDLEPQPSRPSRPGSKPGPAERHLSSFLRACQRGALKI
jgi:hypothetical protein